MGTKNKTTPAAPVRTKGMTTEWYDIDGDEGPIGTLEFVPVGQTPTLELHLWRRDEEGRTTGVWLDEDGTVLRVERAGEA